MRKISLCLTNYNRKELLMESFAHVLNDERISEIIISDDHSDEDIYIQYYFKNPLPEVADGEYTPFPIRWGYHNIAVPDGASIEGHMQSEKYFSHCADIIRHYFELKDLCDFNPPGNSVAIHVRLGDYDNNYHPRLGMKYYGGALKDFPSTCKVYVFSDTPKEARKMFGSNAEYVEGNHYMVDFYMLTRFRHFIVGNSTFSWWPAWLSGYKVFAPAYWFGHMAMISPSDMYCNEWKVI
jgi:glycosyltransferase involved in cell wall biosynthesis